VLVTAVSLVSSLIFQELTGKKTYRRSPGSCQSTTQVKHARNKTETFIPWQINCRFGNTLRNQWNH